MIVYVHTLHEGVQYYIGVVLYGVLQARRKTGVSRNICFLRCFCENNIMM